MAPCADCFSGHLAEGTPVGKVETIHGLSTYVSHPPAGVKPKGLIVYLPDAFGWEFKNSRLLCDKYAEKVGALVWMPDFMDGNAPTPYLIVLMGKIMGPTSWFMKPYYVAQALYYMVPWLIKCRTSVCKPRIFKFFTDVRTSEPPFPTKDLKIGTAGFCWGGLYTFLLCADAPSTRTIRHSSQVDSTSILPLIDCGFTAHPSNLSLPKDAENVNLPLSVIVGDTDMALSGPKIVSLKEILEVKKKGDHEVTIVPGAKHGFGVRTDPKDAFQMECGDKAESQAVAWFSRCFA